MGHPRNCPQCAEPFEDICRRCGSRWIPERDLYSAIADHLARHGFAETTVALHEAPAGDSPFDCPDCRRVMSRVRLRGIAVDRCDVCTRLALDNASAELISRRVLVSAQTRSPARPAYLARGPRLDAGLAARRRVLPPD